MSTTRRVATREAPPATDEQDYVPTFGPLGFKRESLNGSVVPPANHADAQYLNFLEGMRWFEWQTLEPQLEPAYEAALARQRAAGAAEPADYHQVRAIADRLPAFQWRNWFFRGVQHVKWDAVFATYREREAELLAELDRTDRTGPGSVSWERDFAYPDYAAAEIHLQPGGYFNDELAGFVYHLSSNYGFVGLNNNDGVQRSLVQKSAIPADGVVRRVLDLGTAVGQSATALDERFPQAEVHAIDVSAPMVRYAHRRSLVLGRTVHYHQMLAEALTFDDASFDLVYAYILFHELPAAVTRHVIREAHRALRPGGVFNVFDFGKDRYRSGTPYNDYLLMYMVEHNNEVYAEEFCRMDFEGECLRAGFNRVEETSTNGISQIVAIR